MLRGVAGIILSGGPQSVYDKGSPQGDPTIVNLNVPILGLCYGHQWLAHALGGRVAPAKVKEYGPTKITITDPKTPVFTGLPQNFTAWMSHGDEVADLPPGFSIRASTKDCAITAMADEKRKIYGIQFHIEVTHTEHGMEILQKFTELCKPVKWSIDSYADHVGAEIKNEVKDRNVFMLVSGGVDSSVAFTLLNKVLGPDRVQGLLVDTGLMRKGEVAAIKKAFDALGIKNLHVEDASEEFFAKLKGIYEPEKKRQIIGDTFISVQRAVSERMGLADDTWMLGQGTIYPDTIETGGTKHADKIKTHHNRVDMIQKMIEEGLVIEPLKELYKDEVRMLGEELGLPHDFVWRQPFPGPGLGVRILCAPEPSISAPTEPPTSLLHLVLPVQSVGVQGDGRTYRHALALFSKTPTVITEEHRSLAVSIPNGSRVFNRVLLCTSHTAPFTPVFTPTFITRPIADLLREADSATMDEMRTAKLSEAIWQFPVVLLPFGASKNSYSIVLRPIESTDAMTAASFILDAKVLASMTKRLLTIKGIDAVFFDLTNKPPGTIEWE